MDKKLLECLASNKFEALIDTLQPVEDAEVIALIDQRLVKGKGNPVDLIRAVFAGSPVDQQDGLRRRMLVFKHCISVLQNNEINSKVASELIGLLMLETDSLSAAQLAELAGIYVEAIKSGLGDNARFLELLPKIMTSIDHKDMVLYGGDNMKGSEYKSHILNTLCSGRWDPANTIHLATMFKDIPMQDTELKFVIAKILQSLKEVDLQELPPLVYQLLLLSTKGHKKLVLEGVTSYFVEQDRRHKEQTLRQREEELSESCQSDQLQHIEGTIILHMTFAIKQDQDLGRELVKYLKGGQQSSTKQLLAPFNVALALSVAKIHRFEEQIFDFMKATILKSYKDCEKQHESHWVREMVPDSCDIEQLVLDTVRNSVIGWDHVTQGLVQLGFSLMDAFGPKASFGRITDVIPTTKKTPNQKACSLGTNILIHTFKAHEMVRAEILEQILNRVVTKATSPVSHYIDLLGKTVSSAPQILMDSLPKVREAFDYLSFLPLPTAEGFMKAIQPLLKISMSLKDSLILVLRKAMFSRQMEARRIAVNGFLLILGNFKVLGPLLSSQASQSSASFSLSQVQVDVHIPHNPASNEALCLEILGNLRRCLSQQAEVRLTLYEGLYDILCKNLQLGDAILCVLVAQLKGYYVSQQDFVPPVQLDSCIVTQGDQTFVVEPLAHLLSCIVQCLLKVTSSKRGQSDDDDEEEDVLDEAKQILESLTQRMSKSAMEDFQLDKNANFSMNTTVGVKNNISAILVGGIYEVLMEYCFTSGDLEVTACETVIELFTKQQAMSDLLREKSGGGGKKGTSSGSAGAQKNKNLLSLKFLTTFLKAVYCDNMPDHQESLDLFRQNLDLQKYVMSSLLQKCQQIQTSGTCEGPEGHNLERNFKHCCVAARTLLKHYTEYLNTNDQNKRDKEHQIATLAIETTGVIVSIIHSRYLSQLPEFLCHIDQSRESGTGAYNDQEIQDLLHKHIKKFQRMIVTILTDTDGIQNVREVNYMLNLIGLLTHNLSSDGEQFTQVQTWVQRMCTEQTIDDISTSKTLISQLFSLSCQQRSCAPLIRDMARDIHSLQGDIDQEVEVEESKNFSIISIRMAAPTVLTLVVGQIEKELEDSEWVIGKLRNENSTLSSDDSVGPTQQETTEKSVCSRLGHLINTLHELVQSAVPKVCVEGLLKVITHMYNTLASLSKYNLWLHQQKSGLMSTRFEKLVKLSGSNLTPYVYAMITYIQVTQNELLPQANEKGKKDKKKSDKIGIADKARAIKETKLIPNLIFAIEQYEKYLIQLTKKSKVNLMDHFKMSTSRDFRINAASLTAALEGQSSSEGSESESPGNEDEEENQEPPAKRQKSPDESVSAKGKLGLAKKRKAGLKNNN